MRLHFDLREHRGAAGREVLADGVKVVHQVQASACAWYDEAGLLAVVVQSEGADPVGIQRAGAVELGAGDVPLASAWVLCDACGDLPIGAATLPPCVAKNFAVQQVGQPVLQLCGITCRQQAFDKAKAGAQGLRDVGVGGGNVQQQLEQVAHRAPWPSVLAGMRRVNRPASASVRIQA